MADVHVQTILERGAHRALRIEAMDTGVSLQKLLNAIIMDYLTKSNKKKEDYND